MDPERTGTREVDTIGEQSDPSEQEVLEDTVSLYWTLREAFQLMNEAEESMDAISAADDIDLTATRPSDETNPTAAQTPIEEQVSGLSEVFDDIHDEVIRNSDAGSTSESVRDDFDELSSRITALESSIDRTPTPEELASLETEVESLRHRLDTELANLESVLSYLVDTSEELESRTDSLPELEGDVRSLLEDRDRLAALKRNARHKGITEARCGTCGHTADILILPSPYCPGCGHGIRALENPTGVFSWFRTPRLVVSTEASEAGTTSSVDNGGSNGEPANESARGEFEWVGDTDQQH